VVDEDSGETGAKGGDSASSEKKISSAFGDKGKKELEGPKSEVKRKISLRCET